MKITDESPMPFGAHKGKPMEDVPADYLIWLLDNDRAGSVASYITDNLDVLEKQAREAKKPKP